MDLASYLKWGDENSTPPVTPSGKRHAKDGSPAALSVNKLDPNKATPVENKILGRLMFSSPPPSLTLSETSGSSTKGPSRRRLFDTNQSNATAPIVPAIDPSTGLSSVLSSAEKRKSFDIFSLMGDKYRKSSSQQQQERRPLQRIDNLAAEGGATISTTTTTRSAAFLHDVQDEEVDRLLQKARTSLMRPAFMPSSDEGTPTTLPCSSAAPTPTSSDKAKATEEKVEEEEGVVDLVSPGGTNYFLSSSSSESGHDDDDDQIYAAEDKGIEETLHHRSSASSSPFLRPHGPSSAMFNSMAVISKVTSSSSSSSKHHHNNIPSRHQHHQTHDVDTRIPSHQRSELLLTPSPPESPARPAAPAPEKIEEEEAKEAAAAATTALLPVFSSSITPPEGSRSVERLLTRAQAIRTPELIVNQSKVQDWLSQRVVSAVKRFVFRLDGEAEGGGGELETMGTVQEEAEGDSLDDVFSPSFHKYRAKKSGIEESSASTTSSMRVLDGESIEEDQADDHQDDEKCSIISDITSPGLRPTSAQQRRRRIMSRISPRSIIMSPPPPTIKPRTYHGSGGEIISDGDSPFPTGFPAPEISPPACLPSGCGPALAVSRAKQQQLSQQASLRPWGAAGTCSLHRPELRLCEMIEEEMSRLRLEGPPSSPPCPAIKEVVVEEEKAVQKRPTPPTLSAEQNAHYTESCLSAAAFIAAASSATTTTTSTAGVGASTSTAPLLSPHFPAPPPCSPASSPMSFPSAAATVPRKEPSQRRPCRASRSAAGLPSRRPALAQAPISSPARPAPAAQVQVNLPSIMDAPILPPPSPVPSTAASYQQQTTPIEAQQVPAEKKEENAPPCLIFREGQRPVLAQQVGEGGGEGQPLREIRLTGFAGEAVVCCIPVKSIGPGPLDGKAPLVVKASVHYPASSSATFQVSPTYLSFGPSVPPSQTLNLRLVAEKAGEYAGFLALEYMGAQAQISLHGIIRPRHDGKDGGGWFEASSSSASTATASFKGRPAAMLPQQQQQQQNESSVQPTPVTWRRLLVGCSASREIQLRNIMKGPCFVQTCVEGRGFEVDGGGEVGAEGILRLVLTFRPLAPGPHEGTLRIIVWEGMMGPSAVKLQSNDGRLDCSAGTGRRVYSISLSGTAYERGEKRRGSSSSTSSNHRPTRTGGNSSSSSSSSFPHHHRQQAVVAVPTAVARPIPPSVQSTAPTAPSSTDINHRDRDMAFMADDGTSSVGSVDDAFSLSGDSVLLLSMTKPRAAQGGSRLGALRPISVFFHTPIIRFGRQDIGSVTVMKLPICNPLSEPQLVMIEDLGLPFVILHRCIRLRPRSFVRLPIRFVPVASGSFSTTLHATVHRISSVGVSTTPASAPSYSLTVELSGEAESESSAAEVMT